MAVSSIAAPLLKAGIKASCVCIGTAIAGPFGTATGAFVGAALGSIFGKTAADLAGRAAEQFFGQASEKFFDKSGDSITEKLRGSRPTLERLYIDCFSRSLSAVQNELKSEVTSTFRTGRPVVTSDTLAKFAPWFENWNKALKSGQSPTPEQIDPARVNPDDYDRNFQEAMQRLYAQGAQDKQSFISLEFDDTPIPDDLIIHLKALLPPCFNTVFEELIVGEEYNTAWKQAVRESEAATKDLLASIKKDTTAILGELAELGKRQAGHGESLSAILQAVTIGPQKWGGNSDDGFRVAVLPFKSASTSVALAKLCHKLTEAITVGLSRFSHLRIIPHGSTLQYAKKDVDPRVAGKKLGAHYVMEGTVWQDGSTLRLQVGLIDTNTGVILGRPEEYKCRFSVESHFKLPNDLVPRVVCTFADTRGVLALTIAEDLSHRAPAELTPHEAVLRSFTYFNLLTVEEHADATAALELAVTKAHKKQGQSDVWAWLAIMYREEHVHGYNARSEPPLRRAYEAALRAIELGPTNHWAHLALASVFYYQRRIPEFRAAAKKAIDLNRIDASSMAYLASLLAVSGQWRRGCALMKRALNLNSRAPGWYRIPAIGNAYLKRDYKGALEHALNINMPKLWISQFLLAAIYGQLGELEKAQEAVRNLISLRKDFASVVRKEFEKRYEPDFLEHLIDGLRKAGLEIAGVE
jgi:TolB-like protein